MHATQVLWLVVVSTLLISTALARSLPQSRDRHRRQLGDVRVSHEQLKMALGQHFPRGCLKVGCGLLDIPSRTTRSGSDQRIAELQALIALSKTRGLVVGHGQVDPYGAGKRKRSNEVLEVDPRAYMDSDDPERLEILKRVVQKLLQS